MNGIRLIGLNHKTAPVELRGKCRVEDPGAALAELKELAGEAALLSTCNRFEVYVHDADPEAILAWIARRAGTTVDDVRSHGYLREGRNAIKHLFFVTSSLDSLVVGETQIRRQVRDAYHAANEAGAIGAALHGLFQAALRVSKEIAEKTGVGRGNVSVAGAASALAERVFRDLENARVLIVGAGETAELVAHHLQSRGVRFFAIVNRDGDRARALADRFGGAAADLGDLEATLGTSDIVVGAAGGNEPLVTAAFFRSALRMRRGRPIVAIDIAVPRCIDPAADGIDNVYRYDMEALEAITRDALRHRRKEFVQCCTLVDAAALRLRGGARARGARDAIQELRDTYEQIALTELEALERKLPELTDEGRDKVRRAIRRILQRLLHQPVRALREGGPEEQEVIRRTFAGKKEES